MSATDWQGRRRQLPRVDATYWSEAEKAFAAQHPQGWKMLGILRLRIVDQWTFEQIGRSYGHDRGVVCRWYHRTQRALEKILSGRCAGAG